ncbi:MAG TPA: phosphatase PAP2 family protein [Conexibacter sp.]|nr:phosphatase PAP2 family protein [Conexibacter sp.]
MKPVWLAAAAALIGYLLWRRRRGGMEPTLLVGGVVAAVGMAVYGLGLVHPPNLDTVLKDVGGTLGAWTYLLVGGLCFLESGAFVGLVVPGETAIIVGGVVAGQGHLDLILLIAIVWASAVAGDLFSFMLGRRLGRGFLVQHGPKVSITQARIEQVERFYDRHGGKAVFLGRFVGLVRAVSPFLAASSGMPLRRFLPYDVLAAGAMGTALCVVGYLFWHSLDKVLAIAKQGTLALATTIVLVTAIVAAVRWLRVEENRSRLDAWFTARERTPLLGPLVRLTRAFGRRLARPARFAWDRLTPGELGLELTSLLAVASVGSFVFFGYMIVLDPITRLTAGDRRGVRWAMDLQTGWLEDLAKVVTQLGTLAVAGGALAITAAVLIARRRRIEGIALLAGLAATWIGVHATKALLDRPRPSHQLVETSGSAYPSGHSAYAICWVAIAVALRYAFPRLATRAVLLVAAVVVAVAVGLTRIYLRVHWFSDVAGGWGLGATAFALAGVVALVVAFVRGERALSER